MTGLIILLCVVLLVVVTIQVSKISELASKIRGGEDHDIKENNRSAKGLVLFMVVFLVACAGSAMYYKNYMLGYGPHQSASAHGSSIDNIFNTTLWVTAIVFFITQFALFWFSYKGREEKGKKALYMPHDNKLEVIWTIAPAFVMTFLVIGGLIAWNDIMADIGEGEDYLEIEATGYQFGWEIRYPGADGLLGTKDFRLINVANNPLGQDWEDVKNLDDFKADEIVLPVGQKVRVRITSKDVLHNFYLPHFRVKMDAVPGMPTYFVFTPTMTTEEYRESLSGYDEYQFPADPLEPDGPRYWESFNYELACAELCGSGHYAMRRLVKIVTPDEYKSWVATQNSYFLANVRNTDSDPYKGKPLPVDIEIDEVQEVIGTSTSNEEVTPDALEEIEESVEL